MVSFGGTFVVEMIDPRTFSTLDASGGRGGDIEMIDAKIFSTLDAAAAVLRPVPQDQTLAALDVAAAAYAAIAARAAIVAERASAIAGSAAAVAEAAETARAAPVHADDALDRVAHAATHYRTQVARRRRDHVRCAIFVQPATRHLLLVRCISCYTAGTRRHRRRKSIRL